MGRFETGCYQEMPVSRVNAAERIGDSAPQGEVAPGKDFDTDKTGFAKEVLEPSIGEHANMTCSATDPG